MDRMDQGDQPEMRWRSFMPPMTPDNPENVEDEGKIDDEEETIDLDDPKADAGSPEM